MKRLVGLVVVAILFLLALVIGVHGQSGSLSAAGVSAFDGLNPTPVVMPFTVDVCVATLKQNHGTSATVVTADYTPGTSTTVNFYAFSGSGIPSSVTTDFSWYCVGH